VSEINLINAGEDTYQIFALGHHDLKEFMRKVAKEYPSWPMGKPEHVWMVRAPRKGYSSYFYPCDKDHPKAVPMTCTIEGYAENKYQEST
jgi:hypothetical protein